jgi:hypothetical protein
MVTPGYVRSAIRPACRAKTHLPRKYPGVTI